MPRKRKPTKADFRAFVDDIRDTFTCIRPPPDGGDDWSHDAKALDDHIDGGMDTCIHCAAARLLN